jgi:Beta-lactamase
VAGQPPGLPPGTAWSYSSTGYVLLSLIVEAATGNTLARELVRCIFGPLGLLAEMLSTVTVPHGSVPLPLYDRYGLGLLEVEIPAGRLVGNVGGIPGFLSIVLSTPDGRRQLGVMINVLAAPDPVYEAFTQLFRELGARLLSKRR